MDLPNVKKMDFNFRKNRKLERMYVLPEDTFKKYKDAIDNEKQMSMLDKQMKQVLNRRDLSVYNKWYLYRQLLSKYETFKRYLRSKESSIKTAVKPESTVSLIDKPQTANKIIQMSGPLKINKGINAKMDTADSHSQTDAQTESEIFTSGDTSSKHEDDTLLDEYEDAVEGVGTFEQESGFGGKIFEKTPIEKLKNVPEAVKVQFRDSNGQYFQTSTPIFDVDDSENIHNIILFHTKIVDNVLSSITTDGMHISIPADKIYENDMNRVIQMLVEFDTNLKHAQEKLMSDVHRTMSLKPKNYTIIDQPPNHFIIQYNNEKKSVENFYKPYLTSLLDLDSASVRNSSLGAIIKALKQKPEIAQMYKSYTSSAKAVAAIRKKTDATPKPQKKKISLKCQNFIDQSKMQVHQAQVNKKVKVN